LSLNVGLFLAISLFDILFALFLECWLVSSISTAEKHIFSSSFNLHLGILSILLSVVEELDMIQAFVTIINWAPKVASSKCFCHLLELELLFCTNNLARSPLIRVVRVLIDREAIISVSQILRSLVQELLVNTDSWRKLEDNFIVKNFIVWELFDTVKVVDGLPLPPEIFVLILVTSLDFSDLEFHFPLNLANKILV